MRRAAQHFNSAGLALLSGLFFHHPLAAQLSATGDFSVAYTVTGEGQTRRADPSPTSLVGSAAFGVYLTPRLLLAASTQTFTSTDTSGSGRTTGYGITKVESNFEPLHWGRTPTGSEAALNRDLSFDYTITLPTSSQSTPGVAGFAHQFLTVFDFDSSFHQHFEIDAGDYIGGRDSKPGYKHTGVLSLISQTKFRTDGTGPALDFEVDSSPSSEEAPASVVASEGVTYAFRSGLMLTAAAVTGITANDPEIGFSVTIKFNGNLARKRAGTKSVLSFSRLRRLQGFQRFGRLGPF